jgi:hypothetical protein
MWFTFPRTIRGWFMVVPLWHGRGGTRIPESGTTVRSSRSDSASESGFSEDLAGAGVIGDSIGITATQFTITTGTTRGAEHSTTGAISTVGEGTGAGDSIDPVQETGAEDSIGPEEGRGRSTETGRLPEDMRNLAVKAAPARGPSVATTVAERQEAFPHAGAPVLVVAEAFAAAVAEAAGIGNRSLVAVPIACETQKWRKVTCRGRI